MSLNNEKNANCDERSKFSDLDETLAVHFLDHSHNQVALGGNQ